MAPQGFDEKTRYDERGLRTTTTDQRGKVTRYEHISPGQTNSGLLAAVVSPEGRRIEARYDARPAAAPATLPQGAGLIAEAVFRTGKAAAEKAAEVKASGSNKSRPVTPCKPPTRPPARPGGIPMWLSSRSRGGSFLGMPVVGLVSEH
ncbi:hypothetical protein, partial [Saccharothrix lopnurensis]